MRLIIMYLHFHLHLNLHLFIHLIFRQEKVLHDSNLLLGTIDPKDEQYYV